MRYVSPSIHVSPPLGESTVTFGAGVGVVVRVGDDVGASVGVVEGR